MRLSLLLPHDNVIVIFFMIYFKKYLTCLPLSSGKLSAFISNNYLHICLLSIEAFKLPHISLKCDVLLS